MNHPTPLRKQRSPHEWQTPVYGRHRKYVPDADTSPLLDKAGKRFVQSSVGSMLYYARAIEHTILVALNDIALDQAQPTQKTEQKIKQLFDYLATYPNAVIRYHASDMILHVHSDVAYLVLPHARSRVGGLQTIKRIIPTLHATAPFLLNALR